MEEFRTPQAEASDATSDALAEQRGELVGLAYLLTGNIDDAQDIVHDVIARLLATDLSHVEDVSTYARRAVVNECTNQARRQTRFRRSTFALTAEWHRILETQPDPHQRVEVLRAVGRLPSRQRAAIVMRYYLDWDDATIGTTLDCRNGTVRSLLSRGIRRLREQLQEEST